MTAGPATRFPHDTVLRLHRRLLAWYRRHGRELPWREHTAPYHILVSECMLQQTQAARVAEKFPQWLRRFPTIRVLASATPRQVLLAWSGMGYNRRALNLHAAARAIVREHGGEVPDDVEALRRLPGIGRYSAHAVLCFAFRRRTAVVDVNVRRILSRISAPMPAEDAMMAERDAWALAAELLPRRAFFDWNQALMDLGALVCTARSPRCGACPWRTLCPSVNAMQPAQRPGTAARSAVVREVPRRLYRGKVIEMLRHAPEHRLAARDIGRMLRDDFGPDLEAWLEDVLLSLERDGLLRILPPGGTHPCAAECDVELAE